MKKIIYITILLIIASTAFAQKLDKQYRSKVCRKMPCPKVYFGLGTGFNNPNGLLGFNFDVPIVKYVSVNGGVGVSTWGNKIYGEARYYLQPCQRGFAVGGGITHSSGITHFKAHLDTYEGRQDVTLNLFSETNLYLAAYHFWTVGHQHNRFYVDAGYSVPLQEAHYHQISNYNLTDRGRDKITRMSPGGFMVGVGFSFGLQ